MLDLIDPVRERERMQEPEQQKMLYSSIAASAFPLLAASVIEEQNMH